jgi:hypothetical protein
VTTPRLPPEPSSRSSRTRSRDSARSRAAETAPTCVADARHKVGAGVRHVAVVPVAVVAAQFFPRQRSRMLVPATWRSRMPGRCAVRHTARLLRPGSSSLPAGWAVPRPLSVRARNSRGGSHVTSAGVPGSFVLVERACEARATHQFPLSPAAGTVMLGPVEHPPRQAAGPTAEPPSIPIKFAFSCTSDRVEGRGARTAPRCRHLDRYPASGARDRGTVVARRSLLYNRWALQERT